MTIRRPNSRPIPHAQVERAHKFARITKGVAQEIKFAREYFNNGGNGSRAYLAAGYTAGTAATATVEASNLLRRPSVQAELGRLLAINEKKALARFEDLARYFAILANAHHAVIELSPVRHGCCRYCYGLDHLYQFNDSELIEKQRKHLIEQAGKPEDRRVPFDDQGGGGFNFTLPPSPECPVCQGQGIYHPHTIDFEHLSPEAKMLFDGVKVWRDGSVEIKLNSRVRAAEFYAQLMGWTERDNIDTRKPLDPLRIAEMPDEELDAALEQTNTIELAPGDVKSITGAN